MVSSKDIRNRQLNAITRKIPNRRMSRQTIVVEMPRKYISIAY